MGAVVEVAMVKVTVVEVTIVVVTVVNVAMVKVPVVEVAMVNVAIVKVTVVQVTNVEFTVDVIGWLLVGIGCQRMLKVGHQCLWMVLGGCELPFDLSNLTIHRCR